MIDTYVLPAGILDSGMFYYNCGFEQDSEYPHGYYMVNSSVMTKTPKGWRFGKGKDKYVFDQEKNKIESEIKSVRDSVGNPYYVTMFRRFGEFKVRIGYNYLYPKSGPETVKPKYLKPRDCFVHNDTKNIMISGIRGLPYFVKSRVSPTCLYVVADCDFAVKSGADAFCEEMYCFIQMCKSLSFLDKFEDWQK